MAEKQIASFWGKTGLNRQYQGDPRKQKIILPYSVRRKHKALRNVGFTLADARALGPDATVEDLVRHFGGDPNKDYSNDTGNWESQVCGETAVSANFGPGRMPSGRPRPIETGGSYEQFGKFTQGGGVPQMATNTRVKRGALGGGGSSMGLNQMQQDWADYFDSAKPGDIRQWAGGTLEMGQDGRAVYTDPQGARMAFNQNTSLNELANNPYIQREWIGTYNINPSDLGIDGGGGSGSSGDSYGGDYGGGYGGLGGGGTGYKAAPGWGGRWQNVVDIANRDPSFANMELAQTAGNMALIPDQVRFHRSQLNQAGKTGIVRGERDRTALGEEIKTLPYQGEAARTGYEWQARLTPQLGRRQEAQIGEDMQTIPLQGALAREQIGSQREILPHQTRLSIADLNRQIDLMPNLTAAQRAELKERAAVAPERAAAMVAEYQQAAKTAPVAGRTERMGLRERQRAYQHRAPMMGEIRKQAMQGYNPEDMMAAATGDVEQQYADASGRMRREMGRMGVDPSSGRMASQMSTMATSRAADIAGARTQARRRAKDLSFDRLQAGYHALGSL